MKTESLIRLIAEDINTILFYKNRSRSFIHILYCTVSPSFLCTTLYRTAHSLHQFKIPFFPRIVWWLNFLIFKVDIDQRCELYGGIYLPHPMGIVIGQYVSLRGHIKIMQGVTIGGNLGKTAKYGEITQHQPWIDGQAFVGPNSILAGPITLRGKIFISANTVLSKNANNSFICESNKFKELTEDHEKELYTD
jgi:serine O-acetyltransferase